MTEERLVDKLVEVCLRRGFINPTAEIYGGLSGFYDYGPLGTLMRQKIEDLWRQLFVLDEDNIFEIKGSLILPEKVFAASGHLDAFNDPLVQCKKCKSMHRADTLVKEALNKNVEGLSLEEQDSIIAENDVKCPNCKGDLEKARYFNLMFKTEVGPTEGNPGYLRPETAQNIFINFKRIVRFMRNKLPFGIAQVGSSFRNEISPRNFVIRVREFEQMELEMFFNPEKANEKENFYQIEDLTINVVTREMQDKGWDKPKELTIKEAVESQFLPNQYMAYYLALESEMFQSMGIPKEKFWFRHMLPSETPHYSGGNYDLEVDLSAGHVEVVGNAYRRDYDLLKHAKGSNSSFEVPTPNGKVLPHVVEPSMGIGRILYTILELCYREDEGRDWSWFQFPSSIAPIEVAVFPLMKKDGLKEIAQDIHVELKDAGYLSFYDESGNIGRRYARSDEVGIPYCITIDYDTKEEETVTIRDRDSMNQIRIFVEDLEVILGDLMDGTVAFEELMEEYGI